MIQKRDKQKFIAYTRTLYNAPMAGQVSSINSCKIFGSEK
jgi:hypothetical protein